MNILISVDPLTDLISAFMQREQGTMPWEVVPITMVTNAVESFNHGGLDAASDSIFEAFQQKGLWTQDNVRAIDNIVASFGHVFQLQDQKGSKVVVDYDSTSNTAIVKTVPVVVKADAYLDNLKEEYHHALERNDYVSERLRRAFEELSR